jgi:beta-phosphoglucomutase
MAREGLPVTREQFLSSFGQRNDSILSDWLGAEGSPERISRISSAKEELYRKLVRTNGIRPLPGVRTWLQRLNERGWLQAIASAAPRPNVEVVLEALSETHYFQGIVSAEDVHHGKPDPEVYLTAASRVGVSPERCVVVEDASAGLEGAHRAGIRSIGVSRDGKHLTADVVVRSLDFLKPDTFETLLDSRCGRGLKREARAARGVGSHRVPIPRRFADQLKEAEETGIGYQVVGIKLKDGRSFDQVAVSDGCIVEVRGHRNIPFAPEDVASLTISHKYWHFRD